jgi:thymidylate synthase
MNSLDKQYTALLQDILDNGVEKKDRTGTGTLSVFGRQIRHNMKDGFPALTTKKIYFKGVVTELLWFLRGDTNIKYLVDNDCHIWDGDAYQGYLKRVGNGLEPATKERFIEMIKNGEESRVDANGWRIGELGPVYGKQWRNWKTFFTQKEGTDQIENLINNLKTNPDSRRLMVNAWNVGELDQMVLPPCHYGFQVYTRELSEDERYDLCAAQKSKMTAISEEDYIKYNIPTRAISLMWNQRSVDTFLGLPFNIASYGLLLEIIAKEVNMVPDELIGNLGDTHLYNNHIEQAKEQIGQPIFEESPMLYPNGPMNEGIKKQIMVGHTRKPYPLPTLKIEHSSLDPVELVYKLENYQSHPAIKAPLSN